MTNDATLLDPSANRGLALDATQAAPSTSPSTSRFTPPTTLARTTVLPRIDGDGDAVSLSLDVRSRYEQSKVLGAGGMGEVVLVSDHDIGRKVALKRLLPDMTDQAILARFVDEIRTVGRLEHPNIVPIHDVGVDAEGRYFFVMKYVDGETLESVIEKLAAGDAEYVSRFSVEGRIEVFLGLLHALEYAHARGIVHRDIKPANVMIGRFGEVILMDWGIAKTLADKRDPAAFVNGSIAEPDAPRARMYATRVGTLIGTPAYMSPEQASGDPSKIDARSDIYSAIVLFHELLGLEHYLADKPSLEAMLAAIKSEDMGYVKILGMRRRPPAELMHLLVKGLNKDPAKRFQSATELVGTLQEILEGKARVQCHMTFTKRTFRELGRLVDRAPLAGFATLMGIILSVLFAATQLIRLVLRVV